MHLLKTGSAAQLRWLRVFEPLMVITGIVQPLAIPSISKLYFTHSQHASGRSLTTWSSLPSQLYCGSYTRVVVRFEKRQLSQCAIL